MLPSEYVVTSPVVRDKTLGYLYFMDKTHPLCDAKGRVWHHRHIASVKIGRWLTASEVAHHKNHNRASNAPSNLVVKTKSVHMREHALERRLPKFVSRECSSCLAKFKVERKSRRIRCSVCKTGPRLGWPSDTKLSIMIWRKPALLIAKYLGVSSSAVKKHCKRRGIKTPGRGHWGRGYRS
jgi:LSD1 subclass zinc finger protein